MLVDYFSGSWRPLNLILFDARRWYQWSPQGFHIKIQASLFGDHCHREIIGIPTVLLLKSMSNLRSPVFFREEINVNHALLKIHKVRGNCETGGAPAVFGHWYLKKHWNMVRTATNSSPFFCRGAKMVRKCWYLLISWDEKAPPIVSPCFNSYWHKMMMDPYVYIHSRHTVFWPDIAYFGDWEIVGSRSLESDGVPRRHEVCRFCSLFQILW